VPESNRRALVQQLFSECGRTLLSFFERRVARRADAAELAQEVYVRMLSVPRIDNIRDPESYLFAVASNLVREHNLKDRRFRGATDVTDPIIQEQLADWPAFHHEVDEERRAKKLRILTSELSPKCRSALVLKFWHGMSYEEIALHLGISPNMVKKYLKHGLAHCRLRLAELG
jgi:RNA polymerase sigma factor (sigma-70 family)